jgi:drug/metabolite transporter (DMT)-like permease
LPSGARSAWALLACCGSAFFFGLNATATKILYAPPAHTDAIGLVVARSLWTLPLFFALAFFSRPRPWRVPSRTDLAIFFISGVGYGPGTTLMYALGVGLTSGAHAVLLLSLVPPVASILAVIFLHERLRTIRIVAIALGAAGAATLTLTRSTSGSTPEGDALILIMVVMWAVMTLSLRMLNRSYPPLFVAGVMGVIGTVIMIAFGAALHRLDAGLVAFHSDPITIFWFDLELVVLLSVTAQLLQSVALRYLTVGVVAALTAYGTIFVGVLASVVILKEQMTVWSAVAAALLLIALALALVPVREPPPLRGEAAG